MSLTYYLEGRWGIDDLDAYFQWESPEDPAAGLRDDTLRLVRSAVIDRVSAVLDEENTLTRIIDGRKWQFAGWPDPAYEGILLLRELRIAR